MGVRPAAAARPGTRAICDRASPGHCAGDEVLCGARLVVAAGAQAVWGGVIGRRPPYGTCQDHELRGARVGGREPIQLSLHGVR